FSQNDSFPSTIPPALLSATDEVHILPRHSEDGATGVIRDAIVCDNEMYTSPTLHRKGHEGKKVYTEDYIPPGVYHDAFNDLERTDDWITKDYPAVATMPPGVVHMLC
ncbi:MAG: hypothetical protein M3Y58_10935, partial [Chloroflexota bacterium]|nr:hypothetical protein [Chloroflexota bacterium]